MNPPQFVGLAEEGERLGHPPARQDPRRRIETLIFLASYDTRSDYFDDDHGPPP